MEVYRTEEEQLEQLKDLWSEYGRTIVFSITFVMLASFGWRYWQQQQNTIRGQASVAYEQLLESVASGEKETIISHANLLIKDYAKTPYAKYAAFIVAKSAVDDKNYALAEEKLNWVIAHAKVPSVKQIARLRQARVFLSEKKLEQAMELLTTVDDDTFTPAISELKGDILLAMGKKTDARAAYAQALETIPEAHGARSVLQMKFDNLAEMDNQVALKKSGEAV